MYYNELASFKKEFGLTTVVNEISLGQEREKTGLTIENGWHQEVVITRKNRFW